MYYKELETKLSAKITHNKAHVAAARDRLKKNAAWNKAHAK